MTAVQLRKARNPITTGFCPPVQLQRGETGKRGLCVPSAAVQVAIGSPTARRTSCSIESARIAGSSAMRAQDDAAQRQRAQRRERKRRYERRQQTGAAVLRVEVADYTALLEHQLSLGPGLLRDSKHRRIGIG